MMHPIPLSAAARRSIQPALPVPVDPKTHQTQSRPNLRRYVIKSLLPGGDIAETRHVAPALPVFEDAFCAFARGSVVDTDSGPVAVEDLLPGDRILTSDGTAQPLVWKGSTTIVPGRRDTAARKLQLTRIMADSFGMQRPVACMIAGPSARLLYTPDHLRGLAGNLRLLTPVQEFTDGLTVIETTPPSAVDLFHLCLSRHAIIRVNGLEFETYHPGLEAARALSQNMRPHFLNLFPHISQLCDFGEPVFTRAGDRQPDPLRA